MAKDDRIEAPKCAGNVATRIAVIASVAAVSFLTGFVPMKTRLNRVQSESDKFQREMRLLGIRASLASAAIDAGRAEYEPARQAASNFFTELREEFDRDEESVLSARQREQAGKLLKCRDAIITLLARSDAASADELANLYVTYRNCTAESVPSSLEASAEPIER